MQILGSKKGASQPQKPHIAKDDLISTDYYKGLYGLCEGEIEGLADGGKSIKLDGTPLINANGQPNFKGVTWDFRTGTLDQSHISGFPAVENEQNIGVELRHDRPYTKAINNKELSAVRVRLNLNALREQKDNGDITGYAIEYAIDLQTDTGAFVAVLRQVIRGKASNGFKRSHRIDLPPAKKGWTIRIRRITPNRDSDLVADTMSVDAITEIIDAKLAYPCTALLGLSYDAKTFSNIAKVAVRLKGKIIQVPTNYNPQTRQYTGLWDGTFKMAYSNNPAWVFYDLCTHRRYGLGERLNGMVDKWRLYQIGQYCDDMVDDGKGGKEPRFTVNVYIQKAEDAYKVLQNLASVFRGMSFWDGSNIVVDSDTPKEPVYTFSPANIVGGEFSYTGTRARDRNTAVKVAWDNPDNDFKTEYEAVQDEESIATQGLRMLDINAFGCTSLGQAQRAGLWALKSEQLETRSVTFKTGLQGFIPQVGQVINIADDVFAGRAISGRIVNVNGKQITLDRVAGKIGDTLTVATADGVLSAKITAINGETLTLQQTLNVENQSVWAIVADDLKLMQFRVLTIEQHDDATFSIHALQYEPQKFDVVDNGVHITPQPYSVLKATPITAPNSVTLTASTRTVQGQAVTTLTINWEQVQGATAYIVKWRKDDGNWQTLPKVSGQSVDIDGIYAGKYLAQVQAVDSFDNESLPTTSVLTTINGKTGKPPRLAKLAVKGMLFGMELNWTFARGSEDTNFTEIQVSPDGRSNIATLGTFSYPTNSHTINGLQGNLIQFYRARIVDKLGNTSDWTAWTKGVTDSSADKVLDLLNGQITQSQLHQDLVTPIAKIPTLETGITAISGKLPTIENSIATISGQLPTLNGQIAILSGKANTLQNELNTAKNTLQTAVSNITTERNRINTAIRDIGALQTANNAKTQELANLTQTVNGHTSQVRELGVTTGDLTQKYSQLKTATDTANSEITAIKQTQNGQATSIERLSARFDNGNLFKASTAINGHFLDENNGGQLTAWGSHRASDFISVKTNTVYEIRSFEGNFSNLRVMWYDSDKNFVKGQIIARGGDYATFNSENASFVRLSSFWTRQESNVWQMQVAGLASDVNANLETLRQTLTNADTALSQQITAMDTAYKSADRQLTANLASEQTARTNADTALGQRIDTLQSDYDGNKASVANQLKTLSDKDTATATQISQLTANVTTAQNTANMATTKADNAQSTANNALNRANTANSAITAEQRARADADSSLASQITALDTAYKSADSQLSGRITTAQQTATNAQNAVATAQSELTAKFDSLAVGGRNLLKNSSPNVANANYLHRFELTVVPNVGDEVIVTLWGDMGEDRTGIGVYNTHGFTELFRLVKIADGIYQGKGRWRKPVRSGQELTPNDTHLNVYFYPNSATSQNRIDKIKLEKGNVPTDYTQAPEDLQTAIDEKASTATLNEFKQTSVNADTALGERITAIDTAYKQADTATNAKLANAEKAISDNNTALSQRITALDTAYKKSDTDITARLAREETARTNGDNANSQAIRTLESTVNGIGGRVGTSESKIATLERTTSDLNGAIATTQSQLNARFDNLRVGGRNLLLNTQNPTATQRPRFKTTNAGTWRGNLSFDGGVTRMTRSVESGELLYRLVAPSTTNMYDLEFGTYTFSGKVRTNSTNLIIQTSYHNGTRWNDTSTGNIASENWTDFKVTITIPDIARGWYVGIREVSSTIGNWFEFKELKLEKGNIATDWTPAPEDTQSQLNEKANTATLDEFKQAQAQKDTATATQISQLTANVTTAQNTANTATTKADNAQSTANNALSRANTANTAITAEQKARADADSSLASQITALDTAYKSADNNLTARLAREETARTNGDNANSQAIRTLESTVNGIGGRVGTSESKIATLERTTSDLNGAIATTQSQLNARFDGLAVGGRNLILNSKQTLTVPAGGASNRENQQIRMGVANIDWTTVKQLTLSVDVKHADDLVRAGNRWWRIALELAVPHTDGTTSYPKAMITAPIATAFNGRISYVWDIPKEIRTVNYVVIFVQNINSSHDIIIANPKLEIGNIATDWIPAPEDMQVDLSPYATNASLNEFKQAQATKDTATTQKLSQLESGLGTKANTTALDSLATKVNQADGKITAEAQKVSTLQTTVNGQTTSIQQQATSIDGLKAQYTVKIDSGGRVSGFGLASGGGVSDFSVRADKFLIAPPSGNGKGDSPFMVLTKPTNINGTVVPSGTYIKDAYIANGSIDVAKINKASITSLSALTANIGHFKSAETGARLEIKDSVLLVYDDNNRLRVRLGVW